VSLLAAGSSFIFLSASTPTLLRSPGNVGVEGRQGQHPNGPHTAFASAQFTSERNVLTAKALTGKAGLRLWCEAFFKLLFGTAVFAAISGLVLVPIWLSLAGPPPIFAHEGTPPAPSKQEDSTLTSAAVDLGEMEAHT
jgi:hypothetical protein